MRSGKYNAKKTVVDNITFDSNKEAQHYSLLKAMQNTGQIKDLQLQPRFPFPPESWGTLYGPGFDSRGVGCICSYVADFRYTDKRGHVHVVDTKGKKTREFRIKEKLFQFFYPAQHLEVV